MKTVLRALVCVTLSLLLLFTLACCGKRMDVSGELIRLIEDYDRRGQASASWMEFLTLWNSGVNIRQIKTPWYKNLNPDETMDAVGAVILESKFPALFVPDEPGRAGKALAAQQQEDGSFGTLLQTVYAVHAADCAGLKIRREDAIRFLLSKRLEDGGWSLSGTVSDPETTAAVLVLLARYRSADGMEEILRNGLRLIEKAMNRSGCFKTYRGVSSGTSAAVLAALLDCGGNEKTVEKVLDGLLKFRTDEGYTATAGDLSASPEATQRVMLALSEAAAGRSIWAKLAP